MQPQPLQVNANEKMLRGRYSNLMQITHTKEEFVIDFALAHPPVGQVVARIVVSPGNMKAFQAAIQENIKKYEEKFKSIEEAEQPQESMGFQVQK